MKTYRNPDRVEIVYFTGTGGTKMAAKYFMKGFLKQDCIINSHEIDCKSNYSYENIKKADMLLVLYPVYALNAPKPIYEFINSLPNVYGVPAVVVSVSGGGEISPNTACRLHCIRCLEKKGFRVVYEDMIVMPSNFLIPPPSELSVRLLKLLPYKVEKIVSDLFSGVTHQTHPKRLDCFLSLLGELEKSKIISILFKPKAGAGCNGCGLCKKKCPMGNIKMKYKKPVMGEKCTLCLRCIYECPGHALQPRLGKFIILRKGYQLNKFNRKINEGKDTPIEQIASSYSLSGIKKYILELEDNII